MIFDSLLEKLAGKWIAKKMDLQEGDMDETKPWYKSTTIWSDIVTILVAIGGFVDMRFTHGKIATSPIYQTVLAVLGAMGIYGRATATAKIEAPPK